MTAAARDAEAALEQASNLSFFHDMPIGRRRPIEQACPAVMER